MEEEGNGGGKEGGHRSVFSSLEIRHSTRRSLPPSSIAVCLSCLPSLNPVKIVNFSIHLRPLNVFSWSNAVGVLCVVAFLCSYFFSQPVFEQHYYSFLLRASLSPPPKRERSSFEQAGMSSFLGGLAGIARRRQLLVVGWLVA